MCCFLVFLFPLVKTGLLLLKLKSWFLYGCNDMKEIFERRELVIGVLSLSPPTRVLFFESASSQRLSFANQKPQLSYPLFSIPINILHVYPKISFLFLCVSSFSSSSSSVANLILLPSPLAIFPRKLFFIGEEHLRNLFVLIPQRAF
ncbi:hypothetical protein Bca4012_038603 [Brassica carinata]